MTSSPENNAPNREPCCPDVYFCPTSGTNECPRHGGFDVCCDRPDDHRPLKCQTYNWCGRENLTRVSYGDGKPYWRCPVGHVWPKPPPPDLLALDCDDER